MASGTKLTQEEFIRRSIEIHGDKYSYEYVEYINSHTNVKINCKVHGVFEQQPTAHLTGKGCRKCSNACTSKRCRADISDFLRQSVETHGDRYDYSDVEYTTMHEKVIIKCKQHGPFTQKPTHHYSGVGCPACGKEATANKLSRGNEGFILAATKVHGDKYDYSQVEYKNSMAKVVVKCKIHGPWSTSPSNHLVGSGCPACGMRQTGFSDNKIGTLYVLTHGEHTKVGVTNRPMQKRLREICSDSQKAFKVLKEYKNIEGGLCRSLESKVLGILNDKYKQVDESYCGSSECFMNVDNSWLLNLLDEEVTKLKDITYE